MVSSTTQVLHAAYCFQAFTPVCHALALYFTFPRPSPRWKRDSFEWLLSFPVAGGARTFVFQLLSWALLAASLVLTLPAWSATTPSRLDLLISVAAFSSAMSLLFMIKSILLFDPSDHTLVRRRGLARKLAISKATLRWDMSRLPSKMAASRIVVGMGLLWAVMGAALLYAAHNDPQPASLRLAYHAFSLACFTIAAFTTHGLGGHLRFRTAAAPPKHGASHHVRTPSHPPTHHHRRASRSSDVPPPQAARLTIGFPTASTQSTHAQSDGAVSDKLQPVSMHEPDPHKAAQWRFFQPFRGGTIFVATQALGWLLYSTAAMMMLVGTVSSALGVAEWVHSCAMAAGASGVAAEVAIAVSLLAYKDVPGVPRVLPPKAALAAAANHAALVITLYFQVHVVVSSVLLTFLALPTVHAAALWSGGLAVYFLATGTGAEHSGRREWPRFRNWLGREVERVLPSVLGSFEVRAADPGTVFNPRKKHCFCYAPHGLFPIGAAYLPTTPSFKQIVNGIDPAVLSASVVFQLPFLRDLLLWAGARAVGRATFVRVLRERGAVMVVPGGQAELVEAHRAVARGKGNPAEMVVCTRHRGFVRLAMQEGACLVPVVVFGEITSLRNLIRAPAMQRWTYKVLGFPVPFLIGGRAGFLPLPSKTGVRFVVGRPIEPPAVLPGEDISEAAVAELHKAFYDEAERVWNAHRGDFPGYETMQFVRG